MSCRNFEGSTHDIAEYGAALGSELVYAIKGSELVGLAWKSRGSLNWTASIPQLSTFTPVINTQQGRSDRLYFLNPIDGKVYCYDGGKSNQSRWVSKLQCMQAQAQHQRMTVQNGLLILKCNQSIAVLSIFSGNLRALINKTAPPHVPVPMLTPSHIGAWDTSKVYSYHAKSGKEVWSTRLPASYSLSSLVANENITVTTGVDNDTMYVLRNR